MSFLTFTLRRSVQPSFQGWFTGWREWFLGFNPHGYLTMMLVVYLLLAFASYLALLYMLFHLGFAIQSHGENIAVLEKESLRSELMVQHKEAALAQEGRFILESMEKISTIKYIKPASVVISGVSLTP